ncbi:hypothetical protein ACS0TY_021458 [Phlomoides rotata]
MKDHGFESNTITEDLRELAVVKYEQVDIRSWGLKKLASHVMGKEMEKPEHVTTSRWDKYWLSKSQVKYACLDAYVSFKIAELLMAM